MLKMTSAPSLEERRNLFKRMIMSRHVEIACSVVEICDEEFIYV
jgi:hypothetical protein